MFRQIVQLSGLSEVHIRTCARGKIQLNQLNHVLSRACGEGTICFNPGSYPCVTFCYVTPIGVCICEKKSELPELSEVLSRARIRMGESEFSQLSQDHSRAKVWFNFPSFLMCTHARARDIPTSHLFCLLLDDSLTHVRCRYKHVRCRYKFDLKILLRYILPVSL